MKKSILLLLLILVVFTSCKKEGCTDADAENFNTEANEDDGSCYFYGSTVIWWNETTKDNLLNAGIDGLYLHLDGTDVGQSWTGVFWTSAPSCGESAAWTVPMDMGGEKSVTYDYEIKDQLGTTYDSGSITLSVGNCQVIEFTY